MADIEVKYIYKITNPAGEVYIGQTNNPVRRKREYANLKCLKQRKIKKSIVKYGWDNHTWEVIDQCPKEEANMLERLYIKQYGACRKGLNCNNGPRVKGMKPRKRKTRKTNGNSKRNK